MWSVHTVRYLALFLDCASFLKPYGGEDGKMVAELVQA
jgi:hypothetical protein